MTKFTMEQAMAIIKYLGMNPEFVLPRRAFDEKPVPAEKWVEDLVIRLEPDRENHARIILAGEYCTIYDIKYKGTYATNPEHPEKTHFGINTLVP